MIEFIFADTVGLLVQLFFGATILIMIFDKQKPPLWTSIPTGIGLILLCFSYASPVVGALNVVNGILWLIIGVQRYRQSRTGVTK